VRDRELIFSRNTVGGQRQRGTTEQNQRDDVLYDELWRGRENRANLRLYMIRRGPDSDRKGQCNLSRSIQDKKNAEGLSS